MQVRFEARQSLWGTRRIWYFLRFDSLRTSRSSRLQSSNKPSLTRLIKTITRQLNNRASIRAVATPKATPRALRFLLLLLFLAAGVLVDGPFFRPGDCH